MSRHPACPARARIVGRARAGAALLDREKLVRQLGDTLVVERAIPAAFADTMGDTAYLLRHAELAPLELAIELVQGSAANHLSLVNKAAFSSDVPELLAPSSRASIELFPEGYLLADQDLATQPWR